jgi:hypothetical protein
VKGDTNSITVSFLLECFHFYPTSSTSLYFPNWAMNTYILSMIQESRFASLIVFIIFIPLCSTHIFGRSLCNVCKVRTYHLSQSRRTPIPDRSLGHVYQNLLRRSRPKVRGLQSMCALGTAIKQTLSHGQAYCTSSFWGLSPIGQRLLW